MMLEEKIAMAQTIRGRDRFGPVSPEELAALPGTETELHIPVEGGRTVHVYEERPDHLPEKAALVLNFHGGGFIKGRTDRDRRYCCTIMEQLNVLVWDVDYCGETRTVDMHIRTLRQKLGENGEHIETVRGVGYRWEAEKK